MIKSLSHVAIFVLDQDSAKEFYVDKLGFKVNTDASYGEGARWLTVSPPDQPNLEISLMKVQAGQMFDEESAEMMRKLVKGGKLGAGVFETDDCRKTFEELKAKGVQFKSEPEDQFYGVEAIMVDDSGNWFSLTERKEL